MFHTDPTIDQIMKWSDNSKESLDVEPIHVGKKLTSKSNEYEKLRDWVVDTRGVLADANMQRATVQIKNLALWVGLHYSSQTLSGDMRNTSDDDITVDSHKVIINNIYDIERNRYSKISRNQPQTRVVPKSSDYDDYVGSRIGEAVLKTAKNRVRQQKKVNQMLRESFIFGESWIRTWWNKDRGGVDPRWEKLVERLRPGQNQKTFTVDGEDLLIIRDEPIMIGDHDLRVLLPWTLYVDPKPTAEDVEFIIFEDYVHVETLKKLYPKKASQIVSGEESFKIINTANLGIETLRNHVRRFEVFARSSRFLGSGIHFVCTEDVMLEEPEDNPNDRNDDSEWGNIPVERLTDIDVPGRLHGYSTVQILSNLQHTDNQMLTMMKHYLLMLGHPTMLIPAEAKVEMDELSDGSFYAKYYGDTPPSLLVPNPVPPQTVAFAELIRDRMQKLGDLHGVSSGDLPNSVRAARAIRLLQELEDLRATSIFAKYNDLYLSLDRKILKQTKHYEPTDGRLITMLGKANEYLVEDFDVEVLSKEFQVELEISGLLPQQPSARAEFFTDMYQATNGQLFSQEKWVKLFGFENEREFIDSATVSVIKAQRENDFFMKNKKVEVAQPHENHVVELREHAVLVQSSTFSGMDEKRKEKILDHIRTHEYLAFLHMQENPTYKEYIFMQCPWYPLVFKLPQNTMMQMGSQPGVGAPPPPPQAAPQKKPGGGGKAPAPKPQPQGNGTAPPGQMISQ